MHTFNRSPVLWEFFLQVKLYGHVHANSMYLCMWWQFQDVLIYFLPARTFSNTFCFTRSNRRITGTAWQTNSTINPVKLMCCDLFNANASITVITDVLYNIQQTRAENKFCVGIFYDLYCCFVHFFLSSFLWPISMYIRDELFFENFALRGIDFSNQREKNTQHFSMR